MAASIEMVIFINISVSTLAEIVLATIKMQRTKAQTMNNLMVFDNIYSSFFNRIQLSN